MLNDRTQLPDMQSDTNEIQQRITFSSIKGMQRAAKRVQDALVKQLTDRTPALVLLPRFRIVQMGLIPSRGDIMRGLHYGKYMDLARPNERKEA